MARKFEYELVNTGQELLAHEAVQEFLDAGYRIVNIVMLSNGAEPDYDSYNDEGYDRYEVSVAYGVLLELPVESTD